ncbi:Spy/CpxP family protein refolding chaperone [Saccharicrinis sp. GN24d3]|uniref:Spy/CpxP family protein refolding chaperone n=1 Tax=Saccharicrinis sp. GN24d3 TaxID=3458416 RepID=UPI0040373941
MKTNKRVKLMTAFALMGVLIIGSAWGYGDQDGRRGKAGHGEFGPKNGLNLTDAQKEEIKALKISFMKDMTPVKNEIGIKMAELKAASTGDNVDTKAVNRLLDEIGKLKTEVAKKLFANKQKVRSLLTDEQKVIFDAHAAKGRRGGPGKAMRQGRQGRHGDFQKRMKGQGRPGQRLGGADAEFDVEIDIQE